MQVRDAESRSPPRVHNGGCGEKRHERWRGQDQDGPASGTTGGKGRRSAQRPSASPPPGQPRFPFPATQTAPVARGRGHRDAEGAVRRACPPGLRSFGSHFLAAPGPGRLSVRPSPAWPFASLPSSLALRPPLFLPGLFSLPSSPQPCFPASASGLRPSARLCLASPCEAETSPTPKPASREALGAAFAGSGPRPERGFGVSPSACP